LREENYAVDTAEDGDDGLFKAQGGSYDAIVLDVMLPVRNGWQVLDSTAARLAPTPAAHADRPRDTVRDRVKGLDRGADGYFDEALRHRRTAGTPASARSAICWTNASVDHDWPAHPRYSRTVAKVSGARWL